MTHTVFLLWIQPVARRQQKSKLKGGQPTMAQLCDSVTKLRGNHQGIASETSLTEGKNVLKPSD